MTLGRTSGFALSSVCHQIQTGGRSWIMDAKASDHEAHTWHHHTNIGIHIKTTWYILPPNGRNQKRNISAALTTFVLDKSDGFTQAGMTRLNDSIRTYVWAILGSQAQTRSNILSAGTGFDAKKQFLANVEDSISSPVNIPSSIARYVNTLQFASTLLDFVFGIGLYLSPSDMALYPGNILGYNNEIIIAGSDAVIGHNPGINESEPPQAPSDSTFKGNIAPPAGTVQRGPQGPTPYTEKVTHVATQHAAELRKQSLQQAHEDEKLALVTGGIALGLVALWL